MGNKFGIEGEADLKMKYASCLRLINMNADQLKKKM